MASLAKHRPTTNGSAKAWANLNGTGTIAERDSFNISGYTDNGNGDYTFTIANNMGNSNYACNLTGGEYGTSTTYNVQAFTHTISTGSLRAHYQRNGGSTVDLDAACVAIFGALS